MQVGTAAAVSVPGTKRMYDILRSNRVMAHGIIVVSVLGRVGIGSYNVGPH